jgi:hypothetical protein
MIVRHANLGDIETILGWRRERAKWLAERGQDQWQVPWPRPAVATAISAGQTWMVCDGERPVATLTLTAWTDTESLWKLDRDHGALWYREDNPVDALYVSKLSMRGPASAPRSSTGPVAAPTTPRSRGFGSMRGRPTPRCTTTTCGWASATSAPYRPAHPAGAPSGPPGVTRPTDSRRRCRPGSPATA